MKQYIEHHTAWARGYISRKPNSDGTYGYREPYNGRYGKGYIEHMVPHDHIPHRNGRMTHVRTKHQTT